MPKLYCKVEQCVHYNEGLCSKNYIDVDGSNARTKKDTFCKSYLLKNNDIFNYEFAEISTKPTIQTEVYCDVEKCVYEKGQRCYADRIEIANKGLNNNPKTSDITVTHCKTFEPKD